MEKTEAVRPDTTQAMDMQTPPHNGEQQLPHDEAGTPSVIRPTGISWVTLTLGLLCLGLATFVLTVQLADISIEWSTAGPVLVVSAGALLVIAGIASMVTKGQRRT